MLALYSTIRTPIRIRDNIQKELDQAVHIIARCPVIVANAFAAKRHYYDMESLYIHHPQDGLSTRENFLYSVRHDNNYTPDEAQLLDLCLVLHAEHGGATIRLCLPCSLVRGDGYLFPRYRRLSVLSRAAARRRQQKVMENVSYIEKDVANWKRYGEVLSYCEILRKEWRATATV